MEKVLPNISKKRRVILKKLVLGIGEAKPKRTETVDLVGGVGGVIGIIYMLSIGNAVNSPKEAFFLWLITWTVLATLYLSADAEVFTTLYVSQDRWSYRTLRSFALGLFVGSIIGLLIFSITPRY